MADSATLTAAPEAAAEPAKKGKSKLLMILVLVLVVAGAAYWFVLKPKDAGAAAVPPPPEKGEVVALDPIYINLAQGHFLKLGIALQATKSADVKHMDGSEALDAAIDVFSGLEIEQLSETDVRAEHKAELVDRVVESYEDHVMDVYFTEFVMQ